MYRRRVVKGGGGEFCGFYLFKKKGTGTGLAAFLARFKETWGKIFFLSFFTFVTSIFNGIRRSFAAGSPGVVCSDPFGILRQVLLHHPGVSDEWGEKIREI